MHIDDGMKLLAAFLIIAWALFLLHFEPTDFTNQKGWRGTLIVIGCLFISFSALAFLMCIATGLIP